MGRFVARTGNDDPERLERVLDAKSRLIGVDKEALDHQVAEKRARQQAERDAEASFAAMALAADSHVCAIHQQADADRKAWNREVQEFRTATQGKATTRELDLNTAEALRRDLPARIGDDDPRCGPASLQRFDGEDLTAGARTAAQQAQCSEWWAQQAAQRAAAKQAEKQGAQQTAQLVRSLDDVQRAIMAAEKEARRRAAAHTADANRQLAAAKAQATQERAAAEAAAKEAELAATLADRRLGEDPALGRSAACAGRVRPDNFKGMSPAQLAGIWEEQRSQVELREAARSKAAADEADWARGQRGITMQLQAQAQRAEALRRARASEAAAVLKTQIEDKTMRTATLNQTYAGEIKASYFTQFGTSHR